MDNEVKLLINFYEDRTFHLCASGVIINVGEFP